MITIKLPYTSTLEDREHIRQLQKVQSPMIRCAYKQASYGLAEIEVRKEVRSRSVMSSLDSWFQQSAVKSGIGMFKADHELKVESRVFGGRKNLIRRSKGLITQEEFSEMRILPLYCIGESLPRGNRKFEFGKNLIVFKPSKGIRIGLTLPKMRKNWDSLWGNAVRLANEKLIPITVSLTKDHICLSFDEKKVKELSSSSAKTPLKTRYAGIDLNPNYVGVSVFDGKKLISSKLFSLVELTGKEKSDDKILHETREIATDIGKWLNHLRVSKVICEALSFASGDRGFGKNFNRLTKNQWKRESFTSIIEKYVEVIYINAAYSSTIGNLLNPELPDPVAASAEIARRGFEVVMSKSKKFYPELISKADLADRWKETVFPEMMNWKEVHDFVKKIAKLRYRNPLPPEESFRIFSSCASKVYVVDNFTHKL